MRIDVHPVLGKRDCRERVFIEVDGKPVEAELGEPIASALMAAEIFVFHYTRKLGSPRGVFCAIGRCSDCFMVVDGVPNTRTCVTPVRAGMRIETQRGLGEWKVEP
jgi:predicted molibdopterin-dependent oxidoreductase YjgC